jgi:very-short-patch-repair endonuclease
MSFVHVSDIVNRAMGIHSDEAHLEEAYAMFAWRYGDESAAVVDEIRAMWPMMESPIEATIFPYLVMQDYGEHFAPARPTKAEQMPEPGKIVVVPQLVIEPFRLDFAVTATRRAGGKDYTTIVAVECDGREFHSAIRDTKRDLGFFERGIVTIRIPGAQIFAEPADAARRVARLIAEWAQ